MAVDTEAERWSSRYSRAIENIGTPVYTFSVVRIRCSYNSGVLGAAPMAARQYDMYNVQAAETWKKRCEKETFYNAPYAFLPDAASQPDDDAASVASDSVRSSVSMQASSVADTATQQKVPMPLSPYKSCFKGQ